MDSNHRPHAYQACALTTWAMRPIFGGDEEDRTPDPLRARQMLSQLSYTPRSLSEDPYGTFKIKQCKYDSCWPELISFCLFSLERRWSSRTFRYGYLVTTSPQSSIPPSTTSSLRLDYRLRVLPTPMVWRAVCTRPGNVFTAACWSAITSNSDFMQASCSLQSELGQFLEIRSTSLFCCSLLIAIVVRV